MTSPSAAASASARAALAGTIEMQRVGCELAGSDLYSRLLAAVAGDVAAGGPCLELLAPYASAPMGDAVLLRLLAGVHELVLAGDLPELAAHYPSFADRSDGDGGSVRRGDDLTRAFLGAVADRREELVAAMRRGVQTNEVGRSAALLGGFAAAAADGLPLRVLEIGASAGLNLLFDRYHYRAGDWSYGPPDSPVRFDDAYVGRPPVGAGRIRVAERRGCDLDPIDPSTVEGALRLRSFVWPDQLDRLARLEAAMAVASSVPELAPVVDREDAAQWLRTQLAEPVDGTATVVGHSIMFQYLSPDERSALLALLDEAGARATPRAPFHWLRMEPGGDRAEVRLTSWPGGRTRLIARSSYHGPPVGLLVP